MHATFPPVDIDDIVRTLFRVFLCPVFHLTFFLENYMFVTNHISHYRYLCSMETGFAPWMQIMHQHTGHLLNTSFPSSLSLFHNSHLNLGDHVQLLPSRQ